MLTTPAYTQDVATLSDAELETLSAEMQEAFEHAGYDGDSYWTDDEAEVRHSQMQAELRRRHPRKPGPLDAIMDRYCGEAWRSMANFYGTDAQVARAVAAGPKIGEPVQIRKPYRFQS